MRAGRGDVRVEVHRPKRPFVLGQEVLAEGSVDPLEVALGESHPLEGLGDGEAPMGRDHAIHAIGGEELPQDPNRPQVALVRHGVRLAGDREDRDDVGVALRVVGVALADDRVSGHGDAVLAVPVEDAVVAVPGREDGQDPLR